MTKIEQLIIDGIQAYCELNKFIEDNGFDVSDYYQDDEELIEKLEQFGHLKGVEKFEEGLMNACEDNEVMKDVINDYLGYEDDEEDDEED